MATKMADPDRKAEAALNTPPIHNTNDNTTILSFADLFKSHTIPSELTETSYDIQTDSLGAFFDQPWRDVAREISQMSPSVWNGSPDNTLDQLDDLGLLPTEQQEIKTEPNEPKEPKGKRKKRNNDSKEPIAKQTRTLTYPPCFVCGGKASGDHYGINSCEACKGFFRRFLLRKKGAYECRNGGRCEVTHTKKGMCAGCRLEKCLKLGMSKDKCKLGRYSAEKRTEKILTMKATNDDITFSETDLSPGTSDSPDCKSDIDIFTKTLAQLKINYDADDSFTEDLIQVLIQAKNEMHPFGKDIDTNNIEEIKKSMRRYREEFELKTKLYGERKAVPKEDFEMLYHLYGMDVDNRLSDLRDGTEEFDLEIYELCCFARHIPYFSKLSLRDQSNLMKVNSLDVSVILCCHGYDPDLMILKDRIRCYHISEMDKTFSQELMSEWFRACLNCQKLNFNENEQVLVMALGLFFTDRCRLENPGLVEKIQLSLTQLLKLQLEKIYKSSSRSRFTKIIDFLTGLRKLSDLYNKELVEVCKDEIYRAEFPVLADLVIKD